MLFPKKIFRVFISSHASVFRWGIKAIIAFCLLGMTSCLGDSEFGNDGIYDIGSNDNQIDNVFRNFVPSGWMGDVDDIKFDAHSSINPYSGEECIQIQYAATKSNGKGWAGIYWQYPENNWGEDSTGLELSNYTRITFWARGEKGGEKAEFKVGGIGGKFPDSLQPAASFGVITLEATWEEYEINLVGLDLSQIIGGFAWVSTLKDNTDGCIIYLDEIRFIQK